MLPMLYRSSGSQLAKREGEYCSLRQVLEERDSVFPIPERGRENRRAPSSLG